ncbi:hypothetical protein SERLA73DRAFT_183483 [Serpula lacrymans var. lacrymans S7.3]|uniref:Uncharacterized protein n=2 Tax=Serpula lacrymans var. lacrymans TaxID=341189 RepID=F8PZZ0_SERL3|nr:uncharacterized protein SERLADRAFT_470686 [Serpula lacrymans var. lacrymans S7.9]EGN98462.1 hypothetical protein SERLA73DRAFT_183483 [Serpula lacrymans var. lacrymans S7.3]EGO24041.1 hypothetical protein SERLADRAFT_470686 [Serpula lacrymans var. lacrymans S7.9]
MSRNNIAKHKNTFLGGPTYLPNQTSSIQIDQAHSRHEGIGVNDCIGVLNREVLHHQRI